jgi:hypothetical protein
VNDNHREGKQRYLVCHDYGMGGLWWWVWARSAAEIVHTCAEVEVVTDPHWIGIVERWSLDEVDLDALPPGPLADLRNQREQQRREPGFGRLAGKQRVYLRFPPAPDDGAVFLSEHAPDGRRLRQVEQHPDGVAIKTDRNDWPFNPPFDLLDPQYAEMEISQAQFEEAWGRARPTSGES